MNQHIDVQSGSFTVNDCQLHDQRTKKTIKKADKKMLYQDKLPIPVISNHAKLLNTVMMPNRIANMKFHDNFFKHQSKQNLMQKNVLINQNPMNYNYSMNMMNMNLKNKLMMNMNYCVDPKLSQYGKKSRIPFTPEEDEKIKFLTEKYGTKNWSLVASYMPGRTPKQCRDRYSNYLVPGYFKGEWSKEEDELLQKLYNEIGPKWSILKKSFPDRSSNSLKNRWNYFLCRQNGMEKNENKNDSENESKADQSPNDTDYEMSLSALQSQNGLRNDISKEIVSDDKKDENGCFIEPDTDLMDILEHNYIIDIDNDWIAFN